MPSPKENHPVKILVPWCKNCTICKEFCPRQVFDFQEGRIIVAHPERCTLCGMCQIRCPDFAIELEDKEDELPAT